MVSTQKNPKARKRATAGSKLVANPDFTKKRLDAMRCAPGEPRAYFYDGKVRGLALAVTPKGKKSFLLYRKVAGRPERITIGPYPDLSLEQARKDAEKLNGKIASGDNPAEKRRNVRDEDTLQQLFDLYAANVKHRRALPEHERRFRVHLSKWRHRKISSITPADVMALHTRLGFKRSIERPSTPGEPAKKPRLIGGPYAANRILELLGVMFAVANRNGWRGENPTLGVESFPETKRTRFLKAEEIRPFLEAVDKEPDTTIRDFVLLSLLTGARRRNVQSMRWDEIDWARATWVIPSQKAKEGEAIQVVLSDQALDVLRSRRPDEDDETQSEWVFPSRGRTGHLVEPKTAWKGIVARAGLKDLHLHDLRRTLGSWQAATGASMPIIGKTLGHQDGSTATKIYARLDLRPVRDAVAKATAAMIAAGDVGGLLAEGKE
jgi:integrase